MDWWTVQKKNRFVFLKLVLVYWDSKRLLTLFGRSKIRSLCFITIDHFPLTEDIYSKLELRRYWTILASFIIKAYFSSDCTKLSGNKASSCLNISIWKRKNYPSGCCPFTHPMWFFMTLMPLANSPEMWSKEITFSKVCTEFEPRRNLHYSTARRVSWEEDFWKNWD